MSGKRRKQQRSRGGQRRPAVALQPSSRETEADSSAAEVATAPASPSPVPLKSAPASRYAGSVSGPRRGAAATSSTGTIDIDERVPYFTKDLRRIVITAAIMVVLILAGSLLLH